MPVELPESEFVAVAVAPTAVAGWVKVALAVAVQLPASVTVTEYVPEVSPVRSCVVALKLEGPLHA